MVLTQYVALVLDVHVFLLIDVEQSIFSRNAKWGPSIVVSVKNKI
jgi:hypothetical protein